MTFILLVFAAVAAVWGPVLLARTSLLVGCLTFLILCNVAGLEFMVIDVGPINMAIDRFFLLLLLAGYGLQHVLQRTDPKPLRWEDGLLAAFVGLLIVSTFTHDWRGAEAETVPVVQHLANGYLIPLCLFWVARQASLDKKQLRQVYVGLVAFGVYLAVTGLLEAAGQWSLVFPRHIADPEAGIHFGRARGPMVHAVTYGVFLATCTLAGWLLWPRVSRPAQLMLLAMLPVALAAIFFSFTRSVWLGTALALGLMMFATLRGRWRPVVLGSVMLAALAAAVTNIDRIVAFDRTDNTAVQTRESVVLRGSFTYVSWKMFADRPLLGFGFGQFPNAKLPYLSDRSTPLHLESIRPYVHHNTLLSLLTEVGLIGLGLFLAVLGLWAYRGWRLWSDYAAPRWVRDHGLLMLGVLAMYLAQCAFHEMSFTSRDNALLFVMAGLTCNLAGRSQRDG